MIYLAAHLEKNWAHVRDFTIICTCSPGDLQKGRSNGGIPLGQSFAFKLGPEMLHIVSSGKKVSDLIIMEVFDTQVGLKLGISVL